MAILGRALAPTDSQYATSDLLEKHLQLGQITEMIHVASLIHDDVVDDSNIRRKFLTINALWKNKISVLVGDFFLSKALLLSTQNKDYDLLDQVSNAVKEISEGELFQIQKSRSFNITEEEYITLITKKTASLFSCCCLLGFCLLYTSPSPRDRTRSRMPSSA